MKKFLAILLLCILLFNWVGYRIFTSFLETQSSADLLTAFNERNIPDLETISVKVPSSLPYYTGTGEFETVAGEIEINEIQYNYVQRKVTHDSIEYICVVNKTKTAIKKASDQYYKLVNDISQNSTKKDSSAKVKLLKLDYCQAEAFIFGICHLPLPAVEFLSGTPNYCSLSVAPPDLPPNCSI